MCAEDAPANVDVATPSEAEGISPAPADASSADPVFLESPLADAISLSIFAWVAVGFSQTLPFLKPTTLGALAVGLTLLGPLGVAIERGTARRLSWGLAFVVGAVAASAHLVALGIEREAITHLLERGLPLVILGGLLARLGSRFDRGESGWRSAARVGSPTGSTPLTARIAELRPPRLLSILLLPLLPVSLALRFVSLLAIFGYQLTLSRLMPPACRYEPSCSRYGFGAYLRHGFLRGSLLTTVRLIRCSPIGSGGYDPVPRTVGNGVWWSLRAENDA